MIKDCPFCGKECYFNADQYAIACGKCTYISGTAGDYESLVKIHNSIIETSLYDKIRQFIKYSQHDADCAVEKWRKEFTKDSGPIPNCTCELDEVRGYFWH